jgi:hypothetical protein
MIGEPETEAMHQARDSVNRRSVLKLTGLYGLLVATAMAWPTATSAQVTGVDLDTVRAGRFDFGKMWTFEYAPTQYFTETYEFDASEEWFERARLSVLRIPGCSASFVSPSGLVATNHHCVRGAITGVTREGESLLEDGFVAASLEEERRIPNYYADQLIQVQDISREVFQAIDPIGDAAARDSARQDVFDAVRSSLLEIHAGVDSIWVQIVGLYHGGRYSAYVFRRFTDVRLVVAAELQMGFFGGDADNFTYPRYDLDFAFLRIYDAEGQPYQPDHYLGWPRAGVEEGDVVFVIGNPGSTNRLRTIAQLEYLRDFEVPVRLGFYTSRLAALDGFRNVEPELAAEMNVLNMMFGLSNSLKARTGQLAALNDPVIMRRKWDAERALRDSIAARPELMEYSELFNRITEIQAGKSASYDSYGAFYALGNPTYSSALIRRAVAAYGYLSAEGQSAQAARGRLLAVDDLPQSLELGYLTVRFEDFERYLGVGNAITSAALRGQAPAEAAAMMLRESALGDAERTAAAVEDGSLSMADPALALIAAVLPAYQEYRQAFGGFTEDEQRLESQLGRVRFDVYGRSVPPDGTFSPRITDGVVKGYRYNGTLAPPYTTFFGVYDRFIAHGPESEWDLPERWRTPPAGLDLSTPLNFASTADTYGGNSGSPAVTPDLELVGLNFDRNIEGLSRDFIYLPERGRNVMVDVRAIRAALDHVYDADRIVKELETGQLFETEAAADAAR